MTMVTVVLAVLVAAAAALMVLAMRRRREYEETGRIYDMTNAALRSLASRTGASFMEPPRLGSIRAFGAVQGELLDVTFTVTGRQELVMEKSGPINRTKPLHQLVIVAGPSGGACVLDPVELRRHPGPAVECIPDSPGDLKRTFESCFGGLTSVVPERAHLSLIGAARSAETMVINGVGVQTIPHGQGLVPPEIDVTRLERYLEEVIAAARALAVS